MINKLFGKITTFYQFTLVVIMVATLVSIGYFWKLGFLDGSRAKELHEVSYVLDGLVKDKPYKEIKELITRQNPKFAIKKIKLVEKKIGKIDKLVSTPEFVELEKENQKLRAASANLISFSKVDKVVSVFNKKMDKFFLYVSNKNWKTLTRSSQRILVLTSGHVNTKKLSSLTRNIAKELDNMLATTENSILARADKSEVASRVSNLKTEVNMLKKYSIEKNFFLSIYNEFEKKWAAWLKAVSPEITYQKLQTEQAGKYYIISFVGVLALVTLMFFGSFFFSKMFMRKAQRSVEKTLEELIEEGILEKDHAKFEDFSDDFQQFSNNISSYIDKRMSFGSIFQEAMPLSSIMLDKNLKISWVNKSFCESWGVSEEEIKKDYMSWDYLSKLTNIGQDDPVLEALKNNIAGIYQIQIKTQDSDEVRPFEMFVSPVRHNNEMRIMLFFYDLTNLEETIRDQAVSILNPVRDTVNLFSINKFEESEELKNDFSIGGIEDVYESFTKLNATIRGNEAEYTDRICELESEVETYESEKNRNFDISSDAVNSQKVSMNYLKNFKSNIISLSSMARDLDILSSDELELVNTNISSLNKSIVKVEKLKEVTCSILEALPKFDKIKEDIRASKSALYESKMKLSHELAQLSVLMKRADSPEGIEKLSKNLAKAMESFKELDKSSSELDKKVSALEIVMSKAQLVISEGSKIMLSTNSTEEKTQLNLSQERVKGISRFKHDSSQKLESLEVGIIEDLEGLYHSNRDTLEGLNLLAGPAQHSSEMTPRQVSH